LERTAVVNAPRNKLPHRGPHLERGYSNPSQKDGPLFSLGLRRRYFCMAYRSARRSASGPLNILVSLRPLAPSRSTCHWPGLSQSSNSLATSDIGSPPMPRQRCFGLFGRVMMRGAHGGAALPINGCEYASFEQNVRYVPRLPDNKIHGLIGFALTPPLRGAAASPRDYSWIFAA